MTGMILATMAIFASGLGLTTTTQGEINTIENQRCAIKAGDEIQDAPSSERPVLEKCKKKKK
jgi:hypothetical protein